MCSSDLCLQILTGYIYSGVRSQETNIPSFAPASSRSNLLHLYPQLQTLFFGAVDKMLGWKSSKLSSLPEMEETTRRQNRYIHCLLQIVVPTSESFYSRMIPIIYPFLSVALLLVDDRDQQLSAIAWRVVGGFAQAELDETWLDCLFMIGIDILMDRFDLRQFSPEPHPPEILKIGRAHV